MPIEISEDTKELMWFISKELWELTYRPYGDDAEGPLTAYSVVELKEQGENLKRALRCIDGDMEAWHQLSSKMGRYIGENSTWSFEQWFVDQVQPHLSELKNVMEKGGLVS